MGVLRYFFSFKGRINRAKLWLFVLISSVIQGVQIFVDEDAVKTLGSASLLPAIQKAGPTAEMSLTIGVMVVAILLFWAQLATAVKRLHDREKSGWWLLVFWGLPFVFLVAAFIVAGFPLEALGHSAGGAKQIVKEAVPNGPSPEVLPWFFGLMVATVVVGIWGFIELYCLPGTDGDNRFGYDPLMPPPEPNWCSIENPTEGCIPRPQG